jgi:hypothetical protein
MRKTLFLAILFPFAFWYVAVGRAQETTPGSNAPAIIQKPLKGELAPLKLALNQPLKDWLKLLGDGKNIVNENGVDNIITFSFNAGRFTERYRSLLANILLPILEPKNTYLIQKHLRPLAETDRSHYSESC